MRLVPRTGRIGILGGTLDPIHLGHLEAALAAQRALALDPVILMPSRVPPHREHRPAASTFHRFAMTALAAIEHENVLASDEELASEEPSYTARTLDRLVTHGLERTELFFITGADAFAEIETWYRYPAVLDQAHFVVISRPGVPVSTLRDRLPHLSSRFLRPGTKDPMPSKPSIFLVDAHTPEVSSSEIRRRLGTNQSISGMLPGPVERHIRRHRLYMEPTTVDHLR